MKSPNDLVELSPAELALVRRLEKEIEAELRESPNVPYEFNPSSAPEFDYTDRVKKEVLKRAKKAGWIVSDLYADGDFTVRKA